MKITKKPNILVLSGGGIKGIGYAGVVKALEEKGILGGKGPLEYVAGSSAGAIASLFIALGCTSKEVTDLLTELKFDQLLQNEEQFWTEALGVSKIRLYKQFSVLNLEQIVNLKFLSKKNNFGIYNAKLLELLLKRIINEKLGNPNATFSDLEKKSEINKNFKKLVITGTKIRKKSGEKAADTHYFCAGDPKFSDMPLWKAVRASMAIPIFFSSVTYNGSRYTDGGGTDNYPVDYFSGDNKYLPDWANNKMDVYRSRSPGKKNITTNVNPGILGVRLSAPKDKNIINNPYKKYGLLDFVYALARGHIFIRNKIEKRIENAFKNQTIYVDPKGIGTIKFDLSDQEIKKLIKSGYDSTIQHFKHSKLKTTVKKVSKESGLEYKNIENLKKAIDKFEKNISALKEQHKKLEKNIKKSKKAIFNIESSIEIYNKMKKIKDFKKFKDKVLNKHLDIIKKINNNSIKVKDIPPESQEILKSKLLKLEYIKKSLDYYENSNRYNKLKIEIIDLLNRKLGNDIDKFFRDKKYDKSEKNIFKLILKNICSYDSKGSINKLDNIIYKMNSDVRKQNTLLNVYIRDINEQKEALNKAKAPLREFNKERYNYFVNQNIKITLYINRNRSILTKIHQFLQRTSKFLARGFDFLAKSFSKKYAIVRKYRKDLKETKKYTELVEEHSRKHILLKPVKKK